MTNKKTEKVYDVSFHVVPDISEEEAEKVFSGLRDTIARGGEVIDTEELKSMDLAYTIRHNVRQGDGSYNRYNTSYFGSIKFKATQEFAKSLRQDLQSDESFLRFLIIETVAEDTRIGERLPGTDDEEEGEGQDVKKPEQPVNRKEKDRSSDTAKEGEQKKKDTPAPEQNSKDTEPSNSDRTAAKSMAQYNI